MITVCLCFIIPTNLFLEHRVLHRPSKMQVYSVEYSAIQWDTIRFQTPFGYSRRFVNHELLMSDIAQ